MKNTFQSFAFRTGERRFLFAASVEAPADLPDATLDTPDAPAETPTTGSTRRTNTAQKDQERAQKMTNNAVNRTFNAMLKEPGATPESALAIMQAETLYKNFELTLSADKKTIEAKSKTDLVVSVDALIATLPAGPNTMELKRVLDSLTADPSTRTIMPGLLQILKNNPDAQTDIIAINGRLPALGPKLFSIAQQYQKDPEALKLQAAGDPATKEVLDQIDAMDPGERGMLLHLSSIATERSPGSGRNSKNGLTNPSDSKHLSDTEKDDLIQKAQNDLGDFSKLTSSNEKSKAAARIMMNHGVSVDSESGNITAPSTPSEKSMNKIMGIVLLLCAYLEQIKGKGKEATASAPATPPKTPEQLAKDAEAAKVTELETKVTKEGKTKVKADIQKKEDAANRILNGGPAIAAVGTEPAQPVVTGLRADKVKKDAEIQTLKTDIAALETALITTPDDATKKQELSTKKAELPKQEAEVTKMQQDITAQEKELTKVATDKKSLEDLDKAKAEQLKELNTEMGKVIADYNTLLPALRDINIAAGINAIRNLQMDPENYKVTSVDAPLTATSFDGLKAKRITLKIPDSAFAVDGGKLVNPKECVVAIRKMVDSQKDLQKKIDTAKVEGATEADATQAVGIEIKYPGVKFDFKSGAWKLNGEPGQIAHQAWNATTNPVFADLLAAHMNTKLQNLDSPDGEFYLLKMCERSNPVLERKDMENIRSLTKVNPLLKDAIRFNALSFTLAPTPSEDFKNQIKESALYKNNVLSTNLKTTLGVN
jgi:hypothetical protein